MKVILMGGGMVGLSVLKEALADPEIEEILCISRHSIGITHKKLRKRHLADLFEIEQVSQELQGYDACIWTIGTSSVGLNESEYAKITEDLTLLWARTLLNINPEMSFCYCSAGGAGGKSMWARVRQRVETAIYNLPFKYSGAVRPGFIRPGLGIKSRTRGYQTGIVLLSPLFPVFPLLIRICPFLFTTSEILGKAMIRVIKGQADKFILESKDINRIGSFV